MKKMFGMLLVFILIAFTLTGCMGGEDFESYMKALEKTESINQGASQIEVTVESTFNETLLSEFSSDERRVFEQLKSYNFKLENHFNRELDQSIYDVFYFNNNLGMDLKLFQKSKDEMYLKLPFMSALYAVENSFQLNDESLDLGAFMTSVSQSWNAMLGAENIFVGEKTIVKNDDGEVKATLFSVKPTSTQLDIFMRQLRAEILENKSILLETFNSLQSSNEGSTLTESNFEAIVNALFNSMTIKRYEETAYVDLDGYVIDENIIIEIEYASNENFSNLFTYQTITIHTMKWDIERPQNLDFGIVDVLEILPISELEEWSVNQ